MQWLIQCTGLSDTNSLKLLEVVKQKELPFVGIGVIPFTIPLNITGLDEVDPKFPCMFWGSTKLIEIISEWPNYRPGAFYSKEWFDPRLWRGKRSDLLNEDQREITAKELRSVWVDEPMFIKSVIPKLLTGMVIEPVKEDKDNWLIEQSALDSDDLLILSPAQNIELECRFFVINGQIITGSTYRWLGARTVYRPVDELMKSAAYQALKEWIPSSDIVIDICRLKNGKHKIIEFNCINSSGFYNCDVAMIVDQVERRMK